MKYDDHSMSVFMLKHGYFIIILTLSDLERSFLLQASITCSHNMKHFVSVVVHIRGEQKSVATASTYRVSKSLLTLEAYTG